MQIPVLVEPIAGNGYRASTGAPLNLSAEGATNEAAVESLRALLSERISNGTSVTALDLPQTNPWVAGFGMYRDNPLFDEWQQAIEEYRRKADAEDRWA